MTGTDLTHLVGPALASALATKGYDTLTPVQEAVLDEALEGRDLRITSQTGSGKTIAIGFAVRDLLDDLTAQFGGPARPRVLVLAPTRELAKQVADELSWLYAPLRVRVAAVTGGAGYVDQKRALSRRTPRSSSPRRGACATRSSVGGSTPRRSPPSSSTRPTRCSTSASARISTPSSRCCPWSGARTSCRPRSPATSCRSPTASSASRSTSRVRASARRTRTSSTSFTWSIPASASTPSSTCSSRTKRRSHWSSRAPAPTSRALRGSSRRPASWSGRCRARWSSRSAIGRWRRSGKAASRRSWRRTWRRAGIDVRDIARVIQVEPPTDVETYTHRSGRTGRAGKQGTSVLFVAPVALPGDRPRPGPREDQAQRRARPSAGCHPARARGEASRMARARGGRRDDRPARDLDRRAHHEEPGAPERAGEARGEGRPAWPHEGARRAKHPRASRGVSGPVGACTWARASERAEARAASSPPGGASGSRDTPEERRARGPPAPGTARATRAARHARQAGSSPRARDMGELPRDLGRPAGRRRPTPAGRGVPPRKHPRKRRRGDPCRGLAVFHRRRARRGRRVRGRGRPPGSSRPARSHHAGGFHVTTHPLRDQAPSPRGAPPSRNASATRRTPPTRGGSAA